MYPIFNRVCSDNPYFAFRRNADNMDCKSLLYHWDLLVDTSDSFVLIILQLQERQHRQFFPFNAYQMVQVHYSLDAIKKNRLAIFRYLQNNEKP